MDLVSYASAGMPIIVNPGDRDMAVNRTEGYKIKQIHTGLTQSSSTKTGKTESRESKHEPSTTTDSIAESDTTSIYGL